MLLSAFYLFTAAVLLGLVLSLFYVGLLPKRSWIAAAVHALLAVAGLAVLILSLDGPVRGAEYGVQSFGLIAASIAGVALLVGLGFVALLVFAKRKISWLVGAHVTVGITAYFFLMGYVLLG